MFALSYFYNKSINKEVITTLKSQNKTVISYSGKLNRANSPYLEAVFALNHPQYLSLEIPTVWT